MKPMPKTHQDFMKRFMKPWHDGLTEAAKFLSPRDDGMALSFDDTDNPHVKEINQKTIIKAIEEKANYFPYLDKGEAMMKVMDSPNFKGTMEIMEASWDYLINFKIHGERTFFVSQGLAERLAHTELNVPARFLRPPFPTVMMVFDDDTMRESLAALCTIDSKVAARITEDPVSVYVNITQAEGEICPTLSVMISQNNANEGTGSMAAFREILLRDDWSLEQALRTTWDTPESSSDVPETEPPEGFTYLEDNVFFGTGLRLIRTVLNGLLYIGSAAPEISGNLRASDKVEPIHAGASSKAKRDRQARIDQIYSSSPYIEVGASVPMVERGASTGTGFSPRAGTMVRGHWKQQAHGPNWSQHRIVRIEPFWRGPDMAEAVKKPAKPYRMGM